MTHCVETIWSTSSRAVYEGCMKGVWRLYEGFMKCKCPQCRGGESHLTPTAVKLSVTAWAAGRHLYWHGVRRQTLVMPMTCGLKAHGFCDVNQLNTAISCLAPFLHKKLRKPFALDSHSGEGRNRWGGLTDNWWGVIKANYHTSVLYMRDTPDECVWVIIYHCELTFFLWIGGLRRSCRNCVKNSTLKTELAARYGIELSW